MPRNICQFRFAKNIYTDRAHSVEITGVKAIGKRSGQLQAVRTSPMDCISCNVLNPDSLTMASYSVFVRLGRIGLELLFKLFVLFSRKFFK